MSLRRCRDHGEMPILAIANSRAVNGAFVGARPVVAITTWEAIVVTRAAWDAIYTA